jgi:hypothetical protein
LPSSTSLTREAISWFLAVSTSEGSSTALVMLER